MSNIASRRLLKRKRPTGMSGVRWRAGKLAEGRDRGYARHMLVAGSGVMSGSVAGLMTPAAIELIAVVRWQSRSAHLTTHCAGRALPAFGLTLPAALFSLLLFTLAGLMPDDGESRQRKEPREPSIEDWAAEHRRPPGHE